MPTESQPPKGGLRFTYRNGEWNWRAWAEPGDIDATDMPDDEFEALVRQQEQA